MTSPESVFHTQFGAMSLVAVLLDRLGGSVEVTQEDFDKVAYKFIMEESDGENLKLALEDKGRQ